MCFKVRRLERCWFSQIQLSILPLPLMFEGWKTVCFRQSNRHSNHVLQGTKVGTRLVSAKPTVIPTVDFKIRKLERSWFSQNQPQLQPWAMIYEDWNGVGFRKTNGHSNHELLIYEGWNAVGFRKTNPHSNLWLEYTKVKVRRLERGWFSQIRLSIQPLPLMYECRKTVGFRQSTSFLPCALRYEGWNAVDFRKTNRHSNRGL